MDCAHLRKSCSRYTLLLFMLTIGASRLWCCLIGNRLPVHVSTQRSYMSGLQPPLRRQAPLMLRALSGMDLVDLLKNAQGAKDVLSLYGTVRMDLVHRTSVLRKLAIFFGHHKEETLSLAEETLDSEAFQRLLKDVALDLQDWERSGSVKAERSRNIVSEQGQYLSNTVWALGELYERLQVAKDRGKGIQLDQLGLLMEMSLCAVSQLQPKLMDVEYLGNVIQILRGFRRSERTTQLDMIYDACAPHLPKLIQQNDDRPLVHSSVVVFAYGRYGIQSKSVSDLLEDMKSVIRPLLEDLTPDEINLLDSVAAGYALAIRAAQEAAAPAARFSAVFDRRNSKVGRRGPEKLGIAMKVTSSSLTVHSVGDGMVKKHNMRNKKLPIAAGDEIIRVNAVRGGAVRMQKELSRSTDWVLLSIDADKGAPHAAGDTSITSIDQSQNRLFVEEVAGHYLGLARKAKKAGMRFNQKYFASFYIYLLIVGISSGKVFTDLRAHIMRYMHIVRDYHAAEILWILSESGTGDKELYTLLANRLADIFDAPEIRCYKETYPVTYHALRKLGFSETSKPMQSLLLAAEQDKIDRKSLQQASAVPSYWRFDAQLYRY
eukprot:TRINITY_DN112540_c0_g1_i1.p1 TRINITY_DN112540_c0_g1~~TRINITY_DN112540_c0_g1_i1.p1  ORF type:complete len:629 (+),score=75.84 TRINITY_DN112540_c0_g1_i1:82-1887(+)